MTTTRQQIYGLGYPWRGSDIPVMTLWGSGSFIYRLSDIDGSPVHTPHNNATRHTPNTLGEWHELDC